MCTSSALRSGASSGQTASVRISSRHDRAEALHQSVDHSRLDRRQRNRFALERSTPSLERRTMTARSTGERVDSDAHIGLIGRQSNPIFQLVGRLRRNDIGVDHDKPRHPLGAKGRSCSSSGPSNESHVHGPKVERAGFQCFGDVKANPTEADKR